MAEVTARFLNAEEDCAWMEWLRQQVRKSPSAMSAIVFFAPIAESQLRKKAEPTSIVALARLNYGIALYIGGKVFSAFFCLIFFFLLIYI
jgi:hypothetical protein